MNFWPDDADGDVLRNLEQNGFNFEAERPIDFMVDFESWPPPVGALLALREKDPELDVVEPDEEEGEDGGYILLGLRGRLSYDFVINTQKELSELVSEYGGWCESWGVMGD